MSPPAGEIVGMGGGGGDTRRCEGGGRASSGRLREKKSWENWRGGRKESNGEGEEWEEEKGVGREVEEGDRSGKRSGRRR
ncbi:hypothetical protein Pmani_005956 [Petrolisthes manimaculis]|uniref:Uncharacterized protein n=1 Tax=Petrolisthes manimaculis TaxID=1843537 RepID=A0AAE1UG72_9EUCA|nr:hypothetical protein Pmani_005956 [Petrolisthes manimaculis]